jgi:hypothetical protein
MNMISPSTGWFYDVFMGLSGDFFPNKTNPLRMAWFGSLWPVKIPGLGEDLLANHHAARLLRKISNWTRSFRSCGGFNPIQNWDMEFYGDTNRILTINHGLELVKNHGIRIGI